MTKAALFSLGGLVLASVGALGVAAATSGRFDCPGKIVCPLTGELVCADRCPVGANHRDGAESVPSCCEVK